MVSPQNSSNKQPDRIAKSTKPHPQPVAQIESLLKLLVDLEVLDFPKSELNVNSQRAEVQVFKDKAKPPTLEVILSQLNLEHSEDLVIVLLNLLMPRINEFLSHKEAELKASVIEFSSTRTIQEDKIEVIEKRLSRIKQQIYTQKEFINILSFQINNIFGGKETETKILLLEANKQITELAIADKEQQDKIGISEDKLVQLERQSEEQKELVNIAILRINELLSSKEAELKASIAETIAPVTQLAIARQEQEDKMVQIERQLEEQKELANNIIYQVNELLSSKKAEFKELIAPAIEYLNHSKERENKINNIEDKVIQISQQIYNPQELINLLSPVMPEFFKITVAQSKESVAEAIAPIIDEVIQNKTIENRTSMGYAIAPAIPVAITRQMSHSPEEIAHAIAPEVAAAIKRQIQLEREAMVDALYPIIGSIIAKYIAEVIRAINEKLENAFSPEAIGRKIRAKVAGVSEAELLFKEAMPCTVRAIFLIHKSSGLIISEVQSGSVILESEMVAGMLTAIRSFVNECIAQSGDVAEIDAIDYGNSKIILEVAGYCYLATVIQGEVNQSFIRKMRQTLSAIVQTYGEHIKLFQGDSATVPIQVNSLLLELIDPSSKLKAARPDILLIGAGTILSLVILLWSIYQYLY